MVSLCGVVCTVLVYVAEIAYQNMQSTEALGSLCAVLFTVFTKYGETMRCFMCCIGVRSRDSISKHAAY